MTIGAWRSYYELEDSLTLNELIELYGALIDQEQEQFKRDASLQGVDLERNMQQDSGMQERFAQHVAKKRGETVTTSSIPGTGYMQI